MTTQYRKIEPPLWTIEYRDVTITAYKARVGPRCCAIDHEPEAERCYLCGLPLTTADGMVFEFNAGTNVTALPIRWLMSPEKAKPLIRQWVDRLVDAEKPKDDDPPPKDKQPPSKGSDPPAGNGPQDKTDDAALAATIIEIGWPGKAAEIWRECHEPPNKKH